MDFSNLFGGIKDQVDQAVTTAEQTGVPALEASLEKWGANTLSTMGDQSQAVVNTNVKSILNSPTTPGSFSSYLANAFKSPVIQQYGGTAMIGVIAVGFIAVMIFRKV